MALGSWCSTMVTKSMMKLVRQGNILTLKLEFNVFIMLMWRIITQIFLVNMIHFYPFNTIITFSYLRSYI